LQQVVSPLDTPAETKDAGAARRTPQRLAKNVSFFATTYMKERTLLFYVRKEGRHSAVNVLELVLRSQIEAKSRLFGWDKLRESDGATFHDFDEFYILGDCYSLNLFQMYIAALTPQGIELLTLDKKQTMSIPDFKEPAIVNVASRIRDQRPLGMFKLNDQEFLLAYEDCAVYMNKHGDISRSVVMIYAGEKAKGATMHGRYLLLFYNDFVEVRNAENGRLRQAIAGYDMRCVDYAVRTPTAPELGGSADGNADATVKIAMSHPEIPGAQLVLELLLNDEHI
jgi:hypothetical protein